ncbi:MAG: GntR family transcriptional regulator [Myxococcota bacterium]|nr:GntR family transcriptional regulator [Myxococcota bacterium]
MPAPQSEAHSPPRHEAIAEQLRNEILGGTWSPGDRLPGERDLASRLGANRGSVREALKKLEQMGLVRIHRGGGAIVLELEEASLDVARHLLFVEGRLNRSVMEQLLEAHELLVCGATRLAVERASDEEIEAACELIARIADPTTPDDRYVRSMEALLDLMAGASQNLVLRLARRAVNPLFEQRFRAARMRIRPDPESLALLAESASRAIRERNPEVAEDSVRRFMRMRRSEVLDAIDASLGD